MTLVLVPHGLAARAHLNLQGNIMRVVVMLLTLVVGVVLAGCEKTDFEKKSESDANARRIFNLKKESSKQ
ncbi:hypothetical protein BTM36_11610 [Herbaspirillum sp. VT-16-41]|nr:hypothetical protein BTM36_11610 [Herbaspirillum sp. VT-16-41]